MKRNSNRVYVLAIKRLLAVIAEIRSGSYPNRLRLAKMLRVHPRTIQRTINALKTHFGAPIVWDRARGGYRFSSRRWRLDR